MEQQDKMRQVKLNKLWITRKPGKANFRWPRKFQLNQWWKTWKNGRICAELSVKIQDVEVRGAVVKVQRRLEIKETCRRMECWGETISHKK